MSGLLTPLGARLTNWGNVIYSILRCSSMQILVDGLSTLIHKSVCVSLSSRGLRNHYYAFTLCRLDKSTFSTNNTHLNLFFLLEMISALKKHMS